MTTGSVVINPRRLGPLGLVREVAHGPYAAGFQSVAWDGLDAEGHHVSTGVYFIRVASGGLQETLKIAVVR